MPHDRLALQHWAGDLMVVDADAGTVRRYALPPLADGDSCAGTVRRCALPPLAEGDSWELQGALPDGSVLLQRASLRGAESLHRYDPVTGRLRPVTDLALLLAG
jgi:hypothetical protein